MNSMLNKFRKRLNSKIGLMGNVDIRLDVERIITNLRTFLISHFHILGKLNGEYIDQPEMVNLISGLNRQISNIVNFGILSKMVKDYSTINDSNLKELLKEIKYIEDLTRKDDIHLRKTITKFRIKFKNMHKHLNNLERVELELQHLE